MTAVKNEKMNRVTVHLDEKPIYDIVMTEDFSALPGEIEKLHFKPPSLHRDRFERRKIIFE